MHVDYNNVMLNGDRGGTLGPLKLGNQARGPGAEEFGISERIFRVDLVNYIGIDNLQRCYELV